MTQGGEAEPQAAPDAGNTPLAAPSAFEPDRVPARGALWSVAGLLGGVALSALLVWALFQHLAGAGRPPPASVLTAQRLEPPAPRLETTLLGDAPLVRARAALETERYRWLDAGHTRAQVPVSRAMEIVAARGWPDGGAR